MTSDARPGPDFVQLLTPDGELVEHEQYTVDFTDQKFRDLYRDLVFVRRLDLEATALQRQGELGLWVSLLGQEAAQIGSAHALAPQDMVFPSFREHGVLYCRGIDPLMPLSLYRGCDHGGWDPAEHRFALYTIVVGAQTLHATGYAMGITLDGRVGRDPDAGPDAGPGDSTGDSVGDEAVIAYLGDGATSQGDVNEAFVWAGAFEAPIVFFCQNNQYAISAPPWRQSAAPLYRRADGFGFPGVQVDGNDVLATYAVTRAALDQARRGQGPTFIEAYTYRMAAHTSADDPTRYRDAAEVELWRARDPIARLRQFLDRQTLADEAFFAAVDDEAATQALDLRHRLTSLPDPQPLSLFEHVYRERSPLVEEERDQFAAYLASFVDEEAREEDHE